MNRDANGWISTDTPPEHGDHVLVYAAKYPEQQVGRYRSYDKSWTFAGTNSSFTEYVTHWQPFPAPPVSE